MNDTLILFPGALGDFICFLPTLLGLRKARGSFMTVVAKSELLDLLALRGLMRVSMDRMEIADLFAGGTALRSETRSLLGQSSAAYSWTGADDADFASRLASITTGPVRVLPFRGMQPGEHAVDSYARSARVTAVLPVKCALQIDHAWFSQYALERDLSGRKLLVVHPGSGSPAKNWTGFSDLAERWLAAAGDDGRIIVLRGPAEDDLCDVFVRRDEVMHVDGLSLPKVAALLSAADLYVGNDSGISHLAGAVGAKGVVLFGPSDPGVWAPRAQAMQILHAPSVCVACGPKVFCTHRLGVETVAKVMTDL